MRMKYLLPILALLSFAAQARDVTVTWELATQREDGTPLPVTEIASTRIEWGTCSGSLFGSSLGTQDVPAPATSVVLAGFANGAWCFRGYTVDTDGLISGPSNVAQKVLKGRPKPPVVK